ncbi:MULTISPECIES: heavy metal translocating P-type ATPase [Phaeodactylibacter]|jgi:Cd2+/Zn2+-exporting ATPase|uniref:P-type Zn(2+) transporter n=1 Tax=Phaeodactylibacter luteus TaxID=1564516 RepID=A0A5C6RK20_9BACT|nr:heavy metal translocating P-type ATPase [Phaeodactylibacter luteus]TXB62304.1 heavy metal translocating P-type ATPase [Phaeodactylibacter luteus]
MKKLKIKIPVLLPSLPDQKDNCVDRLVESLTGEAGIEYVHIEQAEPSLICIHYQPELITLSKVKQIASRTGAALTHRFRHTLLNVKGVRHQRHARRIEVALLEKAGILEAVVSVSGVLRLEWDSEIIGEKEVFETIESAKLQIETLSQINHPHDGEKDHEHDQDHNHGHTHGGILGENTELYFAIGSGVFWLAGLILSFQSGVAEHFNIGLFVVALLLGGYFTLLEAIATVRKGQFEIDFLMLVAGAGAASLGKWEEAALLLFLFSLGHALENYAMSRARKSIAALSDLAPPTALVRRNNEVVELGVEELEIGDVIIVKPNTKIAADGVIINGNSAVDQAPITGESVPVDKNAVADTAVTYELDQLPAENRAFAGTINGSGALEVKVLKLAKDSTLSKLVELVKEAETQKSPTQRLTDKFERYFVPAVLILVVILLFAFLVLDETFADSFYRAMAVLVAASPCALAISTPSAVLAGVARAARQGVLIKGGRPLEDLGSLNALAFDKTGTLTEGKPRLTHSIPFDSIDKETLLSVAVAVEELSDHPLAAAIVEGGQAELKNINLPKAQNLEALTARGIKATLENKIVHIGNRRLFKELTGAEIPQGIDQKMTELEEEGHTAMIVHRDGQYLGIISVMDVARPEAAATLGKLKEIGIQRMIMLTGDNQKVANAVAKNIGITDPMGNLLPEDKVNAIEDLKQKEGKVAMIGDGVNDAPAMAKSTVGIAMGAAGSDVALQTADIALMANRLDNLPFAIGLSRKAKWIIKQNLWISLGMVAILVPLTLFGVAQIGPAVVAHEGSTLVVVANALRLLAYPR